MSEKHVLKILPEYFEAVALGKKPFEIRKNDRNYQVGDQVILHEYIPNHGFTGQWQTKEITYITDYEQKDGYVVFGIN